MNKKSVIVACVAIIIVLCGIIGYLMLKNFSVKNQQSNNQTATSTHTVYQTVYTNEQYGFKFALPENWKGYSVVMNKWIGNDPNNNFKESTSGPYIILRNPSWTKEKPYQDIPVMVFTYSQWDDVQKMKIVLWAGGVPEELGRNSKYIFILPPRYNFADGVAGISEVNSIIESKAFQAF